MVLLKLAVGWASGRPGFNLRPFVTHFFQSTFLSVVTLPIQWSQKKAKIIIKNTKKQHYRISKKNPVLYRKSSGAVLIRMNQSANLIINEAVKTIELILKPCIKSKFTHSHVVLNEMTHSSQTGSSFSTMWFELILKIKSFKTRVLLTDVRLPSTGVEEFAQVVSGEEGQYFTCRFDLENINTLHPPMHLCFI